MAITQGLTNSFMTELFQGTHNFTTGTGDTFKLALYTSAATLGAATTVYSATNETSGTNYVAGGATLTGLTLSFADDYVYVTFSNPQWTSASFTARGALLYNSSKSNRAVAVIDFGSDKIAVPATPFVVQFPPNTSSTALIRFKRALG